MQPPSDDLLRLRDNVQPSATQSQHYVSWTLLLIRSTDENSDIANELDFGKRYDSSIGGLTRCTCTVNLVVELDRIWLGLSDMPPLVSK